MEEVWKDARLVSETDEIIRDKNDFKDMVDNSELLEDQLKPNNKNRVDLKSQENC